MLTLCSATKGSPDTTIAVLDGAPHAGHTALKGANLRVVGNCAKPDFLESDSASAHATFIASMLVGQRPECLGLCPACRLLCVAVVDKKILNPEADPALVARRLSDGVIEAVESGAQIVQISLELAFGETAAANILCNAFQCCSSRNIVVVLAGGQRQLKRSNELLWAPGVIPVVAADESGETLYDQRWGVLMAVRGLSAPGTRIPGAHLPNGFKLRTGSSFSCSFVSASIALLLATDPSLTPSQAGALLFTPRTGVLAAGSPQPLDPDRIPSRFKLN